MFGSKKPSFKVANAPKKVIEKKAKCKFHKSFDRHCIDCAKV